MIKDILTLFGGIFILATSLYAQESTSEHKHQVQVGYGYNTFNKIYAGLWGLIENAENIESSENGSIKNEQESKFSSLILSYSHPFKERGSWGVSFTTGYYKLNYDVLENGKYSHRKQFTQIYTLTPNLYFHYLRNKTVQMYFGAEVGLLYYNVKAHDTDLGEQTGSYHKIIPVFNIAPIGMRLKYRFSPYIQLNFGSRGWVEGGLSYQFGQR
ncbi:MAG: hypothetical protein LC105_09010 [Chitinophagales bacterium]|nr:hypothetical protein [Chitinophagales bacterium]MCZ2393981.1 hypothetical protein [Chitinophagales bacterium]